MPRRLPPVIWRVALAVAGFVVAVVFVLGWFHANRIRSEFLVPQSHLGDYDVEVVGNEAGRVVLTRTESSERPGFWGVDGQPMESGDEHSYGQVSTLVRADEATVERAMRTVEGEIVPGDQVRMDVDAYTGDPLEAHRIGFEDIVIPSEIGPHPGWFVDGRRATWVLFVHGRGTDRLTESLRLIPSLVEQGYPVMSMSYRNDDGATPSESGLRSWGLEEWRDVEAAIELGERKGAQDFVIVGSGFGASIVSMYLHESDTIGLVRGVVYDSPVIDLEEVVREWESGTRTPALVSWLGRRLSTVRFGIDWGALDQPERVAEFDMPMLLMVGGADPVTDPRDTQDFAVALGEQATFARFEQAAHTDLWNVDQTRYEATISNWLFNLIGPE